ncbi:MAG: hypothetical protein ACOYK8_00365 [Alphaproteobacteria bacterium]
MSEDRYYWQDLEILLLKMNEYVSHDEWDYSQVVAADGGGTKGGFKGSLFTFPDDYLGRSIKNSTYIVNIPKVVVAVAMMSFFYDYPQHPDLGQESINSIISKNMDGEPIFDPHTCLLENWNRDWFAAWRKELLTEHDRCFKTLKIFEETNKEQLNIASIKPPVRAVKPPTP